MSRFHFRPNGGVAFMLAGALVGTGIALWSYFDTDSGVSDTAGALLVTVSSFLLVVDALLLFFLPPGGLRGTFVTLGFLGAIGTIAAAWFLHAWWLIGAMVVVILGLIAALVVRDKDRTLRTA